MDSAITGFQQSFDNTTASPLLVNGEAVVLVDDDQYVRTPIRMYLEEHDLHVLEADSGAAFQEILRSQKVALVLLDIGLPDINGKDILPQIKKDHPDVAVLMLTGVSDLDTALSCIRAGADDYLPKPVKLEEIYLSVKKLLEKRRLIIQNKQYQADLEKANFRIQLMHQLSLKMNSAYLNTVELEGVLQAILVGITANEGLRFNRAFLAMFDPDLQFLRGKLAIGPACQEEAAVIWGELGEKQLDFSGIVAQLKNCDADAKVNQLIRSLVIPSSETEHILIKSANERKSYNIVPETVGGYDRQEIVNFLGTDSFVVVPLYSPSRPLGVIIADNFITRHRISDSYVSALELFSSQASLAIEHSHLYTDMQKTIAELESVNYELDKNKNMLIEAERYSALGQMAAQMVHNLRNPITSIGGIARLLNKKPHDDSWSPYLQVMDRETTKLESILEDMFDFVGKSEIHKDLTEIPPLIRKSLLLLQPEIFKQNIKVEINIEDPDLLVNVDQLQIRKMLVHIFKNAVEAMPDGGTLLIQVNTIVGGMLRISITNTGTIISEEQVKLAKEPFYTTKTHGTGMGLAMVDRIVTAHQGNFTLNKTENGTIVEITLPI